MANMSTYSLRPTPCREAVLRAFQEAGYALSQGDIEQNLLTHFDRVTIYRTLKSFVTTGIIHKVLDDQGSIKYALCKSVCRHEEHHQHDHVHFKCVQCGQTTCLETVHIPNIPLPEHFIKQESNLLIQGICKLCSLQG